MIESASEQLLAILRAEGPLSPASLMDRLGLSQSTLFRSAKVQSENIVLLGAARNRKLAALRSIRGMNAVSPFFLISAKGEITLVGKVLAVYPNSFVILFESARTKPQFYPGLPFFLDDMRPQGFLGKAFAQKYSELKLSPRIVDWNNDDILEAIARRGENLTGNLLVGEESFERYQALTNSKVEVINAVRPEKKYLIHAQAAIDGQPAGSSVGGEHPKFCSVISRRGGAIKCVLVKFSPVGDSFAALRWHDLLICESLSLEILQKNGIAVAENRILQAQGRTFLEMIRFDRIGINGRKGMVSLSALENEWVGRGENWSVSGQRLESQKKISQEDLRTIQKLECFGRMIANTDRHAGNLSFFWQPGDIRVVLAPVYDMLPMLYAPSSGGEDTARIFALPTYDHTLLNAWKEMHPIAIQYWERVSQDDRVSGEFRKIAKQNIRTLK